MNKLMILNFITPFVIILVGYMLKKSPATDMRRGNGYNTPNSRKSQAHWDYAQSIAPDIMIRLGKISLLLSLLLTVLEIIFHISISLVSNFCMAVGFIFMIIIFIKVEKEIKNKFRD